MILVKLGGSLITDKTKPFTARTRTIRRLARELKSFLDKQSLSSNKNDTLIILGHGSGSFAHIVAAKYGKGRLNATMVHDAAAQLNRIVVRQFLKIGLPVVSIAPSSFIAAEGGKAVKFFSEPIQLILSQGMIPVVYGDVVWDKKLGSSIFSTEKVFSAVAESLDYRVQRVVQCGITDGVLIDGKTIKSITTKNFNRLKSEIGGSAGVDVTGGMLHKVEQGLNLAKQGIPSIIINGERLGELLRVLEGKSHHGSKIS